MSSSLGMLKAFKGANLVLEAMSRNCSIFVFMLAVHGRTISFLGSV